ncbi:MAG: vanadium-dependent haloperoxidase [Gemmatimonadaceae bacterium]
MRPVRLVAPALCALLCTALAPAAAQTADTAAAVRWRVLAAQIGRRITEARAAAPAAVAARPDVASARPNIPGRNAVLMSVAMYLAADSAAADPARPAPRAAVAAAAALVLKRFTEGTGPEAERHLAEDLAAARRAGASEASVQAGVRVGRAAAERAMRWDERRRAGAPWTGTVPVGAGMWRSAPGREPALVVRLAESPLLLDSISQFRPPPPPAFGSPEFGAALDEVRRVARERTAEQARLAREWISRQPQELWDPIVAAALVRGRASERDAARVYALMYAAANDANLACTDAKYHYFAIRPTQADSTIALVDSVPLPNHPSYPSGHACISSASAEVAGYFLPAERGELRRLAEEAAMSRLWGSVHFRFDNETGLALGRRVAQYAIEEEASGRLKARWR